MGQNRNLFIFGIAAVMMVLVMIVAVIFTLLSLGDRDKTSTEVVWSIDAQLAPSVNATDVTGDNERDVFVEDLRSIRILDGNGQEITRRDYDNEHTSTQGDADGDGLIDVLAYYRAPQPHVELFNGLGETLWERDVPTGPPSRALAVDFDGDRRSEFVIGDVNLGLLALSSTGEILWQRDYPNNLSSLRGLDDVRTGRGSLVVMGLESGEVEVLDSRGELVWEEYAFSGLRRLRSFPLSDSASNIVAIGEVGGDLSIYDPAGELIWFTDVGQAVNEIRPVEIDGDPATTEVLVGGKDGGVWAFSEVGNQIFSDFLNDKVNEIISYNDAALGGPVAVVGDDTGRVAIYGVGGEKLADFDVDGSVSRLEAAKLGDDQGFLVADAVSLTYYRTAIHTAPILYSPLLAGLASCFLIAIVAFLFSRLKPAPTLKVNAQQLTVEAQKARRRMIYENINDVKAMQKEGAVDGESYLARMQELRGELAEVNQALMELGEPIKPETFSCPHCHGTLELGTDRCEYCGQIVIM
ncbi:MAG: hypothetical protein KDE59_26485 [Anaerolineales bacterium]|nr:hypothetical protein [Anaerolineales bacterium]MCB0007073.1 hypothetical protein [Anaerolineales bacterium]MCB8963065.1 hypothetical protein [Ardenticatenales bacterium]